MAAVFSRPGLGQRRTDEFAVDSTHLTTSRQGVAFIASAILPGAGQYYLGADRWVPFAAAEAWSWVKFVQNRKEARKFERKYRDIAWEVARQFTTSTRKDSVFTYFEAVGEWKESGRFDLDPNTLGLQPEIDSTTFNGAAWRRARGLYSDPAKALAYYRQTAIPDPYLWSWGNSRLEQEEYRGTIRRSDAAFRAGTRMLGVILANHIMSAVDAFVLARAQELGDHRFRIGSTLEPSGSTYLWTTTVRIPLHGAESGGYSRTNH